MGNATNKKQRSSLFYEPMRLLTAAASALRGRRRPPCLARAFATNTPASDIRSGTVVETDAGALAVITKHHYTQGAGRQAGVVQATLRDLRTAKTSVVRWRPDTPVPTPRLDEATVEVLYRDSDDTLHVMDVTTFEQGTLPASLLGTAAPFVRDGARLIVQSPPGGGEPVAATPVDATAVLTVTEVPPPRTGVASSYKMARCEGGVSASVPEYVKVGDRIIVSVADGEFVKRA